MTDARAFHIGDILSVTTGYLVSPRHIDGVYDLLGFMVGEPVFTHQIPRVGDECAPALLAQHPDLADVPLPVKFEGEAHVHAWLAEQVARFGEFREVRPLDASDHTSIDPFAELAMKAPHLKVITVEAPGGDR